MFYFAKGALPESALILAGGDQEEAWALAELDDVYGLTVEQVTAEAARLLESAKAWPPALAFMAAAIDKLEDVTDDVSMFDTMVCELLPWFLSLREQSKCVQAASRVSEPDYREIGEQLWVVAKRETDVLWVSRDYQIYDAPAADFDLSEAALKSLPDRIPLPKWLGSRGSN